MVAREITGHRLTEETVLDRRDTANPGPLGNRRSETVQRVPVVHRFTQRRHGRIQDLHVGRAGLQHVVLTFVVMGDWQHVVRIHGGDAHVGRHGDDGLQPGEGRVTPPAAAGTPIGRIATGKDRHLPRCCRVVGPGAGPGRLLKIVIHLVGHGLTVDLLVQRLAVRVDIVPAGQSGDPQRRREPCQHESDLAAGVAQVLELKTTAGLAEVPRQ